MQFVNDDMDELFRKAAENYPLDTRGGDFNKVLTALQNKEGEAAVHSKKNNRGRYLWLLMLLPMGVVCNYYYSGSGKSKVELVAKENGTTAKERLIQEQQQEQDKIHAQNKEQAQELNNIQGQTQNHEQQPENNKEIVLADPTTATIVGINGKKGNPQYPQLTAKGKKSTGTSGKHKAAATNESNQADDRDYRPSVAKNHTDLTSRDDISNPVYNNSPGRPTMEKIGYDHLRRGMDLYAAAPSADHSLERNTKMIKSPPREKRFYAGPMGGIDMTVVKFQKVQDMGYDAGLVLGYELSHRWSVEAGVFLQQKSYYSDGKYYDVSKIYMPPNSKLAEVSGVCQMIELPLYARYSFSGRLHPYVSLGMSSYLMQSEDYRYVYAYPSGPPHVYDKTYKNASQNFFSAIHVSGGISKSLGNIASLRVEPYVKIPIAGMGYGDLHLWSMGLHLGLTRKF